MNKHFLLITAALVLLSGCSKLTGELSTAHFSTTSSYAALDISNAFDVSFSDEVSDVTVTADEGIMSKIVVEESVARL